MHLSYQPYICNIWSLFMIFICHMVDITVSAANLVNLAATSCMYIMGITGKIMQLYNSLWQVVVQFGSIASSNSNNVIICSLQPIRHCEK